MIAHSLTQELEHRGISRRDFMGFCASMAAVLGLPDYAGSAIAAAVETEAKPILVWLEFQDCAGNSESLLRAGHPTVADLILDSISLNYHETLMAAAGSQAEDVLTQTVRDNAGKYIALVEGSIPTGADGAYFRNNYCPSSVGRATTIFPFCLPNWSGGAYATASATHSHVTTAPYAGGGTVLTSPSINGSTLATYASFDGEVDLYYLISGWHEVSNGGCCWICACGEHREIVRQTHRWDVSAAGQDFHFGGIFVSDPTNLGYE